MSDFPLRRVIIHIIIHTIFQEDSTFPLSILETLFHVLRDLFLAHASTASDNP